MSKKISGSIPCTLFGGPLDGQKYGDLPDVGTGFSGATLKIPLSDDEKVMAVYTCFGDAPVNGLWQFFYDRTEFPTRVDAVDLPIPHPPLPVKTTVGLKNAEWDAGIQVALARAMAVMAHRTQTDKAGVAYITHPARVAARFDPAKEPLEHCAAWLHDVVADSDLTLDDLWGAGIHPDVLALVALLTRRPEFSTDEYYARIAADPRARAVKAADIDDNTDPARLQKLHINIGARLQSKYAKARQALGLATMEGAR